MMSILQTQLHTLIIVCLYIVAHFRNNSIIDVNIYCLCQPKHITLSCRVVRTDRPNTTVIPFMSEEEIHLPITITLNEISLILYISYYGFSLFISMEKKW